MVTYAAIHSTDISFLCSPTHYVSARASNFRCNIFPCKFYFSSSLSFSYIYSHSKYPFMKIYNGSSKLPISGSVLMFKFIYNICLNLSKMFINFCISILWLKSFFFHIQFVYFTYYYQTSNRVF